MGSDVQAKFFCRTGALAGVDHRIGDDATIGRGSANTIVLADDVVSNTHARIAFDPAAAAYFLEDLESTNGTRLDGVPVSGRRRLGDLHVVTFGERHDFIFVALPEAERRTNGKQDAAPPPPARSVEESATTYEPPPVLDVPPLDEGPEPAPPEHEPGGSPLPEAAQGGREGDEALPGPVGASATRYEAAGDLLVPPLSAEPEPEPEKPGAPLPEAASGAPEGDEALPGPVGASATRYEAAGDLLVPPLSAEPEPERPADESGGSPPKEAVHHDAREDSAAVQSSAAATRHEPPRTPDVPLAAESATPSGAVVEVAIADGKPQRVTLGDGRHVLGRAKDCAIPVDDMTLSRRHAAFVVRGSSMTVTDLDSLNGTFIEDEPVNAPTEVGIGRTVTLGNRVRIVRVAPQVS